jgi:hypothetical protein
MSTETLQILLAVAGWVVAFLLGTQLATGYSVWRARRAEQPTSREDGDQR